MSFEQIAQMMIAIANALNCDQAYNAFDDKISRDEYICWFYVGNDDFYADDENYQEIVNLRIEFYTRNKSSLKERTIQNILKTNHLTYDKDYSYINDEKIYLTIYDMEVMINA